jgi:peptidoglycan hydrolase-like protein with peptidoglycan-binding domain
MKRAISLVIAMGLFILPQAASADAITRVLSVGSRGAEVQALQQVLVALGYLAVAPTGYFGATTKQALIALQKANNLPPVGSTGPKTRAIVNAKFLTLASMGSGAASTTNSASASTSAPATVLTQSSSSQPVPSSTAIVSAPSPNDPPKITLVAPSATLPRTTTQTTLQITTDKAAYCHYGTQPLMSLSSMPSFSYSGSTAHSVTFSNLSPGALYVYYVRCEDLAAHVSGDFMVSFALTQ